MGTGIRHDNAERAGTTCRGLPEVRQEESGTPRVPLRKRLEQALGKAA
jgi:hypothetical protein